MLHSAKASRQFVRMMEEQDMLRKNHEVEKREMSEAFECYAAHHTNRDEQLRQIRLREMRCTDGLEYRWCHWANLDLLCIVCGAWRRFIARLWSARQLSINAANDGRKEFVHRLFAEWLCWVAVARRELAYANAVQELADMPRRVLRETAARTVLVLNRVHAGQDAESDPVRLRKAIAAWANAGRGGTRWCNGALQLLGRRPGGVWDELLCSRCVGAWVAVVDAERTLVSVGQTRGEIKREAGKLRLMVLRWIQDSREVGIGIGVVAVLVVWWWITVCDRATLAVQQMSSEFEDVVGPCDQALNDLTTEREAIRRRLAEADAEHSAFEQAISEAESCAVESIQNAASEREKLAQLELNKDDYSKDDDRIYAELAVAEQLEDKAAEHLHVITSDCEQREALMEAEVCAAQSQAQEAVESQASLRAVITKYREERAADLKEIKEESRAEAAAYDSVSKNMMEVRGKGNIAFASDIGSLDSKRRKLKAESQTLRRRSSLDLPRNFGLQAETLALRQRLESAEARLAEVHAKSCEAELEELQRENFNLEQRCERLESLRRYGHERTRALCTESSAAGLSSPLRNRRVAHERGGHRLSLSPRQSLSPRSICSVTSDDEDLRAKDLRAQLEDVQRAVRAPRAASPRPIGIGSVASSVATNSASVDPVVTNLVTAGPSMPEEGGARVSRASPRRGSGPGRSSLRASQFHAAQSAMQSDLDAMSPRPSAEQVHLEVSNFTSAMTGDINSPMAPMAMTTTADPSAMFPFGTPIPSPSSASEAMATPALTPTLASRGAAVRAERARGRVESRAPETPLVSRTPPPSPGDRTRTLSPPARSHPTGNHDRWPPPLTSPVTEVSHAGGQPPPLPSLQADVRDACDATAVGTADRNPAAPAATSGATTHGGAAAVGRLPSGSGSSSSAVDGTSSVSAAMASAPSSYGSAAAMWRQRTVRQGVAERQNLQEHVRQMRRSLDGGRTTVAPTTAKRSHVRMP
eukprot:TRINITY_DN57097_c0_g1_i1.p1 TRINITY_DN57097_c0_g1~~TRINITY_DN57097_c0_g1_i1.p1  ORF type:complete len:1103 (-),score=175.28 TRINITY_DN57097_c0_g1_i1:223-3177(-)